MLKKLSVFVIFVLLLLSLCACGGAASLTSLALLDAEGNALEASDGVFRTQSCTVEACFSGDVQTISFYAVTVDETGHNNGELLASAAVGDAERALYDWDVPDGFDGYIWVVLNGDAAGMQPGSFLAVSSVGVMENAYAVFSCQKDGEPLQVLLWRPLDQSDMGAWFVLSYRDAVGIHENVFVPNSIYPDAESYYEDVQFLCYVADGTLMNTYAEDVARAYLKENLDFVPKEYEVLYQNDSLYH